MLNACTIIACNYLPFARVLADSFLAHHPEGSFTILLIDDEARAFPTDDDRIDWRRLSDIGLEPVEVRRLAGIYDVTELATAVKPLFLRTLLDEGRNPIVYLDPDIRIYASLADVASLATRHGIVLTPHTMQPYPKDERQIDGFFVLAAGVYNLGFVGVGDSAVPFLDWWWQTTRREALIEPSKMMFTDQRWVDFVPSFFEHYILKNPGYNVAYWNLHGRTLEINGAGYVVNGEPLRFFHFSGFDPRRPWLLSKHQGERPRVLLSDRPALARICREYLGLVRAAGYAEANSHPYGWGQLPSGMPMTRRMRRLYWSGLVAAEQGKLEEPPSPFDEAHPEHFIDWLNAPAEGGPRRVSRLLYSIYRDRPDLQAHFPDIYGNDAIAYADWTRGDGVVQENLADQLLPPATLPVPAHTARRPLREGVNVAGYFRAELGIAEAARQLTTAIEDAKIPLSTTTYDATLSRQSHPFSERQTAGADYDINVLCVNADSTPRFARDVGPAFFEGRHTVGYWFWEVEEFPDSMHAAFDNVDEVWTATDFIAEAVRGAGRKPVFTVPLPLSVPEYPSTLTRARLGLSDRFTFLFLFDFLSIVERKNPDGLIAAFTKAFTANEGPVLMLKSINGDLRLAELERLRAAAGDRTDVSIVDGYYSPQQKNALIGACDAYVSLHRSEGLGLTMAEAMALGKPVIATGYSGNMHFMSPTNSYLVDYTRVRVASGCAPYPTTAYWADPDLDRAAALMREVYEQPAAAAARAAAGRREVLERHNRQRTATAVAERIAAIRRQKRSRVGLAVAPSPTGPAAASGSAATDSQQLEAVLPALADTAALRLSTEGRTFRTVRAWSQRALFRVLRPVWFQQHQFHDHVVAAMRHAAAAIRTERERGDAIGQQLQEVSSALAAVERRIETPEQSVQALSNDMAAKLASMSELSGVFQSNAANHLAELTKVVQRLEVGLATLSEKLFAPPYMTDRQRFTIKDAEGRNQLGYVAGARDASRGFYVGFEDLFRGPENIIRERQRVYVPLLEGRPRTVDVGCGRGELLDLLRARGSPGVGVDIDADMVRLCRSKGHTVEERDALAYLREREPASLDALFTAQLIEHLPFEALREFLSLCRSRLAVGGLLIAETVNPHSLEAFKTFYTDLTHQRPIFPEVALALCQLAGFDEARILFPLGSGNLEDDRRSQGEYAVIATVSAR